LIPYLVLLAKAENKLSEGVYMLLNAKRLMCYTKLFFNKAWFTS
jgi:hypothetical protein